MKFAVTGSTGLLGNNLVRLLLRQGHQVRVGVRPSSAKEPLHGLDVEIVTGQLDDPAFAQELLQGTDGLFHAAALIWLGKTRQEESRRANVIGSEVLARECLSQGKRMVYVSSVDALAASTRNQLADETTLEPAKGNSAYVTSKRMAEQALLKMHGESGLDVVIVNPGLMLGPWDWKPSSGQMILAVTDGFMPFAPGGEISACDVRNVAAGTIAAMKKGRAGERYILAGVNMPYMELWRKMAARAGRRGPLKKIRLPMAAVFGTVGDMITLVTRRETNVNSAGVAMGQLLNRYSSDKARQELGYEIGSVDVALDDAWQWLLDHEYTKHAKTWQIDRSSSGLSTQ
ncbi:MAG: NAD-dependent epimerase/dehydratase family protein [Pirellulaceae bacterium]